MGLRAVFLDFDDTLHDFAGTSAAALEQACVPVALRAGLPVGALCAACALPWRQIWARYIARDIGEDQFWALRAQAVLNAAGLGTDPVLAEAVRQSYIMAMEAGARLRPGAAEALSALDALRPRPLCGLLTNGPGRTQRARLRRLQLEERFAVILISGEVGSAKPEGAFFAEALRRARVTADEAVMIGDDPRTDVAGARAAGWQAIWFNASGRDWPAGLRPEPSAVATDLAAATAWVAARIGPALP